MADDSIRGISRRKFIAASGTAGALALAGCTQQNTGGGGGGDDNGSGNGSGGGSLSGEVIITGSSTVFPVSNEFAELFMDEHPDVNVTVDSTGSGGGFENNFCPGDSDINGASRPITDEEVENCESNDVTPVEFQVASDALTVAVNNEADWVDSMTFDELSQIWRDDGAQMWSDVRDDWPDEELELFGPASTSGTYDWFNENVIGEDYQHTAEHEPTEEDNLIVQGIQDSQYAMGYFGYAYYSENEDSVKAVEIREEEGDDPVAPSLDAASEGTYPLARPLFIYASEAAAEREEVAAFLEFYIENSGNDTVAEIGYVPAGDDVIEENMETLEEISG
ncbi:PstS family phosphate ABC transporter substrate-binding protein [Halomarina ordinaria]|uniref:PstS family phosphate ABC transporter substrate-binding protein n=1 Tax=Halomarina ordinaria TaxID=3033939 RepID=A0ABD5UCQ2_9EURY|nr:PstS family phosphate ABC transporter substrate-binding protein [Halomarina sp. PSRA2]